MGKINLEERLAAMKAQAEAAPDDTVEKGVAAADKKPAPKANGKRAQPPVVRKQQARRTEDDKAQAFAHSYVATGCNATEAYKRAISDRCKDSTAATEGHKYLRKPKVQQYLAPLLEALMAKNEVDAEWVLRRWKEQADGSPLDYFQITDDGDLGQLDLNGITDEQRRNLKEIRVTENTTRNSKDDTEYTTRTVHVKVYDAQKAVEMFAKYLKMLTRDLEEEDVSRIGDLIEAGVKRIRASKDLDAWKNAATEGEFSEVG